MAATSKACTAECSQLTNGICEKNCWSNSLLPRNVLSVLLYCLLYCNCWVLLSCLLPRKVWVSLLVSYPSENPGKVHFCKRKDKKTKLWNYQKSSMCICVCTMHVCMSVQCMCIMFSRQYMIVKSIYPVEHFGPSLCAFNSGCFTGSVLISLSVNVCLIVDVRYLLRYCSGDRQWHTDADCSWEVTTPVNDRRRADSGRFDPLYLIHVLAEVCWQVQKAEDSRGVAHCSTRMLEL